MTRGTLSEDDYVQLLRNMAPKVSRDGVTEHTANGGRGGGAVTDRPARGTPVKSSCPYLSRDQNDGECHETKVVPPAVARTSHATNSQQFFVPGPLPGANDIIRKHHMVYSKLKSQWGLTVARCIIVAKLKRVQYCTVSFLWQEANNRRDDDNVQFAAKFVLDALRDTKIIPDDRRKFIHSTTHRVIVEPTMPGVLVTVEEL